MRQTWHYVRPGGRRREARNVQIACVSRLEYGTIGERDSDWVIITLSVEYAGIVEDEVARGAGVGKCVLCCARRQ